MKYFFLLFLIFSFNAYSQNKRLLLGKEYAQKELEITLSEETRENYVDNERILLKDKNTAVKIAESVLFSIYGKQNIIEKRPYEIYFLDKYYWFITGTLPKNSKGGAFLIIIDARNSKILRISHEK
ncbi:YbbC/YhhH family protein [Flavobacterium lipolyticum]|uniref:YbbC/YhhH family protein n=1 Tax=Flavobacterium lipolyticum TaxID=2893754 RepID=A0ABS8M4R9_9FLAO|nr:YbbC/YhhH family protein [Flavobacterium sp. F-126]MCC9019815.1 YbbC/YhhH family protein [Flavobacterium sp. F-126]